jgi:hypothetical protein
MEVEMPLMVAINNSENLYHMVVKMDGDGYYEIIDVCSDKDSILHLFDNDDLEQMFWQREFLIKQIFHNEQNN